jgi:hypothetical protein
MVDSLFERDECASPCEQPLRLFEPNTTCRAFGRDRAGAKKRSGRRSAAKIEWVRRRCFGNPIGQGITKNYGGSCSCRKIYICQSRCCWPQRHRWATDAKADIGEPSSGSPMPLFVSCRLSSRHIAMFKASEFCTYRNTITPRIKGVDVCEIT